MGKQRSSGCCGCGCLLALAALCLVGYYAKKAKDSIPPPVVVEETATQRIRTALAKYTDARALKVGEAEINVEVVVDRESALRLPWFDARIPFGRTRTIVRVDGNKAQYILPLEALSPDAVKLDGQVVRVRVPLPRPDPSMVSVQDDPDKISVMVDKDWFHHLRWSDEADQGKRLIRGAVLEQAGQGPYMALAERGARDAIEQIVAPIARDATGREVVVLVEFER